VGPRGDVGEEPGVAPAGVAETGDAARVGVVGTAAIDGAIFAASLSTVATEGRPLYPANALSIEGFNSGSAVATASKISLAAFGTAWAAADAIVIYSLGTARQTATTIFPAFEGAAAEAAFAMAPACLGCAAAAVPAATAATSWLARAMAPTIAGAAAGLISTAAFTTLIVVVSRSRLLAFLINSADFGGSSAAETRFRLS